MGKGRGVDCNWIKDARGICNLVAFCCLFFCIILAFASSARGRYKGGGGEEAYRLLNLSLGAYFFITMFRLIGFIFDSCVTDLHRIRETVTDVVGAIFLIISGILAVVGAIDDSMHILSLIVALCIVAAAIALGFDAYFVWTNKSRL